MKKRNLKSLNLNKTSISNLNSKSVNGGHSGTSITPATPVVNFTKGDCVDTLGDDHCWTPTPGLGW